MSINIGVFIPGINGVGKISSHESSFIEGGVESHIRPSYCGK